MPTAKVRWKESEVMRLFRAAKKEGVTVRVEIRPDGTLAAIPQDRETREPEKDSEVVL
jgi:hypothetical protein